MECNINLLFQGNNLALYNTFIENGGDILDSISEKGFVNGGQSTEPLLAGLDSQSWFLEGTSQSSVYNVNNNDIYDSMNLKESISLDSLLESYDVALSPAYSNSSSSDILETPAPSPYVNKVDLEFNNLLDNTNDTVAMDEDSTYAILNLSGINEIEKPCSGGNSEMLACFTEELKNVNLGSPDSGISSSDEMSWDTNTSDLYFELPEGSICENKEDENTNKSTNLVMEFPPFNKPKTLLEYLKDKNDANISEDESVVSSVVSSSEDEKCLSIKQNELSKGKTRYGPYKRKQKTEEQKSRKKMQNRNAALKYRSKKKSELGDLVKQEDELAERNKELKEEVFGLTKEIDYLKKLMLDVIQTRLTKSNACDNDSIASGISELNFLLHSPSSSS